MQASYCKTVSLSVVLAFAPFLSSCSERVAPPPVAVSAKSADISLTDALGNSDGAAVQSAVERAKRAGFPAQDIEVALSWWQSEASSPGDVQKRGVLLTATADLLVQAQWNGFIRLPEEVSGKIVKSMVQVNEEGAFPSDLRAVRVLGMLESFASVTALKKIALSSDKQKAGAALRALGESCESSAASAISELRPHIDADPTLAEALMAGIKLRGELRRCR